MNLQWPYGNDDLCPCGGNVRYADCHKSLDSQFPIGRRFSFGNPWDRTGYSHPKCYLNSSIDCSEKISREHILPRSIVKKFASGIGLASDKLLHLSNKTMSDGFTAKILCERHNNGLSPLDAYFEKIDSVLVEIGNCLLNGNLTEDRIYFIDGFLFESAILKSSMSFMFSKILKEDIDINTVGRKRLSDWLLGWEEPAKECGLSFGMAQAQYKDGAFSYFNTLRDKSKVIGAHFGFRNLYCLIRLFRGNVSAFNGLHAKLIEFKANSGSSCYVFFGWDEPIRAKDQIGRYSGWSDHLWSEKVGSPPWSS